MFPRNGVLCLLDVDGTLTLPRRKVQAEVLSFILQEVKPKCSIGLISGSDIAKIAEQMGGYDVVENFDYVFSENGLVTYKHGKKIYKQAIESYIGEEKLQKFLNFVLYYMSKLTLPVKRGHFVEFRTGLINICPVGRSCNQAQRDEFSEYDKFHNIRKNFVDALKKEFPNDGLVFSIGGQISIDVFPEGWNKAYCLRHLQEDQIKDIHFFGDKTEEGGNDHEIFEDQRTIGHKVESPDDTITQLKELISTLQAVEGTEK